MDHAKEVNGELLKAGGQGAAFFHPTNTALDDVPSFVTDGVIAHRPAGVAFATLATRRNNRTNAVLTQPVPDAAGVIGLVSAEPFRPHARAANHATNAHTVHQLLELRRLVSLARKQKRTHWDAVSIAQEVQLGSEAAS
jgi:S1-C subfamily serine protease